MVSSVSKLLLCRASAPWITGRGPFERVSSWLIFGSLIFKTSLSCLVECNRKTGSSNQELKGIHGSGLKRDFPGSSEVKASACNTGAWVWSLGQEDPLEKEMATYSSIWEGNGNPLQYFCLENPMDGGAWQATVHRVPKSWTRLSNFTFTFMEVGINDNLMAHHTDSLWIPF